MKISGQYQIIFFFLFFCSCVHVSQTTTKDKYKKTWSFWQFGKRSCIRHWKESVVDTTLNYVVQKSKGKRKTCGFYGYDIKTTVVTYNRKGQKIVKTKSYRNEIKHINTNRKREYWNNYDTLASSDVDDLLRKLNF